LSAGAALGGHVAARLDLAKVDTPAYVTDLGALEDNLKLMASVMERAGVTIILALKGFAQWATFPLVKRYLKGTTASSIAEARLGREEFGGEVHAYAPAWSDDDLREVVTLVDHLVLNSPNQWRRARPIVEAARAAGHVVSCGLRVNHEHQEVEVALYDPAGPMSRLGTTRANLRAEDLDGLDGLHFHTLCQLGPDALDRALTAFEAKFGEFIDQMKWVNFGGGHHITRPDYDTDYLVSLLTAFKARHPGVAVYLEPGEAVALGTGVLVASVLDVFDNGMPLADPRHLGHRPHARRPRDAVPARHRRRRRAQREGHHLPPRWPHLPRRRRHRRLLLRSPPRHRRQARVPRHGPLHHGQEHHVQRRPPAGHRHPRPRHRRGPRLPPLRLPRLPRPPLLGDRIRGPNPSRSTPGLPRRRKDRIQSQPAAIAGFAAPRRTRAQREPFAVDGGAARAATFCRTQSSPGRLHASFWLLDRCSTRHRPRCLRQRQPGRR
jgi:carboxynorspermidine decarboxylase